MKNLGILSFVKPLEKTSKTYNLLFYPTNCSFQLTILTASSIITALRLDHQPAPTPRSPLPRTSQSTASLPSPSVFARRTPLAATHRKTALITCAHRPFSRDRIRNAPGEATRRRKRYRFIHLQSPSPAETLSCRLPP